MDKFLTNFKIFFIFLIIKSNTRKFFFSIFYLHKYFLKIKNSLNFIKFALLGMFLVQNETFFISFCKSNVKKQKKGKRKRKYFKFNEK